MCGQKTRVEILSQALKTLYVRQTPHKTISTYIGTCRSYESATSRWEDELNICPMYALFFDESQLHESVFFAFSNSGGSITSYSEPRSIPCQHPGNPIRHGMYSLHEIRQVTTESTLFRRQDRKKRRQIGQKEDGHSRGNGKAL